jgi:peptide/nickel transport system permease protein
MATTTASNLSLGAERYRPPTSMARMIWQRFIRHRLAVVGLVVLLVLVFASAFAPLLSGHDPEKTSFRTRDEPPSLDFPMGTDSLGRDILTRLLYGGRVSLSVGLLAVLWWPCR